jgi:hypothetical protein
MLPAGLYDNPIPTRFLAPRDCSKIPALLVKLVNAKRLHPSPTLQELEAKVDLVVREKISNYHYLVVNQMFKADGW